MHTVIVGSGRVGSELARLLASRGGTVTVIDKRPDALRKLPAELRQQAVVGLGFDRDCLEAAGVADAQAFAAVTNGDNSNIVSARIARETYEVPNVVARIYDPRRSVVFENLGIATVPAVAWTTDQVLRRLEPDVTRSSWTDSSGRILLMERSLPPAWTGVSLGGLDEEGRFRLVGLTRRGQARLAGPGLVGQEGDVVHLVVAAEATEALERRLEGPEAEE